MDRNDELIKRTGALEMLETALAESPVAALLGPRQCGKSTLACVLAEEREAHWFDLVEALPLREIAVLGELPGE